MTNSIVSTELAPAAIGTYSQAVKTGNLTFISGQIPLDPDSMEVVSDEFVAQATQVFKNLSAVADAAGPGLDGCVKLTVYLTNLDDFAKLNEVMADFVAEPYPARAAVQVAALPKGVQIEIDAILAD